MSYREILYWECDHCKKLAKPNSKGWTILFQTLVSASGVKYHDEAAHACRKKKCQLALVEYKKKCHSGFRIGKVV